MRRVGMKTHLQKQIIEGKTILVSSGPDDIELSVQNVWRNDIWEYWKEGEAKRVRLTIEELE